MGMAEEKDETSEQTHIIFNTVKNKVHFGQKCQSLIGR